MWKGSGRGEQEHNLEEVGVRRGQEVIFKMSKGKEEGLVVLETVKNKQGPNAFTSAKSHQDSFPNLVGSFSFSWSGILN